MKVGGTWIEGHLGRVSGSEIEHFFWEAKNLFKRKSILLVEKGLILRQF